MENQISLTLKKIDRIYIISAFVGLALAIAIFIFPIFIPYIYDAVLGNSVISAHLQQVVGNETNSGSIAQKIMNWQRLNTQAPYQQGAYFNGLLWAVVNVSNQPSVFIRSEKASWFIVQKLGNCGENAEYFVEMMNHSGFRSRILTANGEDHSIAEYYDEFGKRIVVDPSSNQTINDTLRFGDERGWSYVEARELNGSTEDVTPLFVSNLSVLELDYSGIDFLEPRTQVTIRSTYLKNRDAAHYPAPINIISRSFDQNKTISLKFGAKPDYEITTSLDMLIVNFKSTKNISLTSNQVVEVDSGNLIKGENAELNLLGITWICAIILAVIVGYYAGEKIDFVKRFEEIKNR